MVPLQHSSLLSAGTYLILDGGDTHCFSQLEIIGEFMRRMNEDRAQKELDLLRPCEYFDLIVGTGFGGYVSHFAFKL